MTVAARPAQRTQASRRARSRAALMEAAARRLSRQGYANLVLADVAADAGFTRGALYHQFANKEALAIAVVTWVEETWWAEMAQQFALTSDPAKVLVAIARAHAIYCRRDVARVMMNLRVEFRDQNHPIAQAVQAATRRVIDECSNLISAGRATGSLPDGAPPRVLALAAVGAIEGLVIELAEHQPFDANLAEQAMAGLIGVGADES